MRILVSETERDAILAGLRLLQLARADIPPQILDIATNCGLHELLESEEIDDLCERLNT